MSSECWFLWSLQQVDSLSVDGCGCVCQPTCQVGFCMYSRHVWSPVHLNRFVQHSTELVGSWVVHNDPGVALQGCLSVPSVHVTPVSGLGQCCCSLVCCMELLQCRFKLLGCPIIVYDSKQPCS
jgi:hypothetical protein